MSEAAAIKSYEPEHLEAVWTVKRQASRTSVDTGVSAAIWTSDRPVEIWGSPYLSVNVLSMALRPIVARRGPTTKSCNLSSAGPHRYRSCRRRRARAPIFPNLLSCSI